MATKHEGEKRPLHLASLRPDRSSALISRTRPILVGIMSLFVACKSANKAVAEFESRRAEMVGLVMPVVTAEAKLPLIEADGLHDVAGPLRESNTTIVSETELKGINTSAIGRVYGAKTHDGRSTYVEVPSKSWFVTVARWALRQDSGLQVEKFDSEARAKGLVEKYLSIRYVVVVRLLEWKPWHVDDLNSTFTAAMIRAEARVLDVRGGDHGGFRFEASNSSEVLSERNEYAFQLDLENNARKAFDAKLARFAPGSATVDELEAGSR